MKNSFKIYISIFIFTSQLLGCTPKRTVVNRGIGDIELARMNAIVDFASSYETPKRFLKKRHGCSFNVFQVYASNLDTNTQYFLVSIIPEDESISIRVEHRLGEIPSTNFPNRFIIKDEKLFLWNDGHTKLGNDILNAMLEFSVLDSTDLKWELGLLPADFEDTRLITIDDRLEAYNYFICRNDVSKFKKVVTYKALGYFDPPVINCR